MNPKYAAFHDLTMIIISFNEDAFISVNDKDQEIRVSDITNNEI